MGTRISVEQGGTFVAATVATASSNSQNSMEGIATAPLVNGTTCWVEENESLYRYFASSVAAAGTTVVVPESGVGRWLMIASPDAQQLVVFPQLRVGAANVPVQADAGPTTGWIFTLPPVVTYLYSEIPYPKNVVRDTDLILGVSWAPTGSELNTSVSWEFAMGFEKVGKSLATIDLTLDAVDEPSPPIRVE